MNSSPKSDDSAGSGNLSVKQQRAVKRTAKLEKHRKHQARAKRNKRLGLIGAAVGAVAILALLFTSIVLTPRPATYEAGSEGITIPGVETFDNPSLHVETPVSYTQTPPAGGEHSPAWLNCGVYTEPVPNENAIHSLEHGAVWVTYEPGLVSEQGISELRSLLPSSHAILSPYENMDTPIAVSAWNAQLKLESVEAEKIGQFFEEYWLGGTAPEPGASCTGAVEGPGKVG